MRIVFLAALLAAPYALATENVKHDPAKLAEMETLATEMISKAAEHYKNVGPEQAVVDFNEKTAPWYADDYFVHMFGMGIDCVVWADNVFPEFVGTDFCAAIDYNGFAFGVHIIGNLEADGTPLRVQLEFDNPDTGAISPSIGMCVQADQENILCSWTNG